MIVRFGYVAMSVLLEAASPSKTVTVKSFGALAEKNMELAVNRVRKAAVENLRNTLRLLRHNEAHGIKMYRFSSKLIPMATHHFLSSWDYTEELRGEFIQIGEYVRRHSMRVSFHPDHFTLLNSPREEVFDAALQDLWYHHRMLEAMGLYHSAKLVIHVGGAYGNKTEAAARFVSNWDRIPDQIRARLIVENDDKTYSAEDVLALCEIVKTPMVLDLHHHFCNPGAVSLETLMPRIFDTWQESGLSPKVHVSSPKSEADFRSHHDCVNPEDVYSSLASFAVYVPEIWVMVEAKRKDQAMMRLVDELARYPGVTRVAPAALEFANR